MVYHEAVKESIFWGAGTLKVGDKGQYLLELKVAFICGVYFQRVIDTQNCHSDGLEPRFTSHIGWTIHFAIIQLAQASVNSSLTVIWELVGPPDIYPQYHVD